MHLLRFPSRIRASELSPEEREWLVAQLEFQVKIENNKTEPLLLWSDKRDEFPSGLLHYIARGAKKMGFAVTVDDRRTPPNKPAFEMLDWVYFKAPIEPEDPKGPWFWSPLRPDQREPILTLYKRTQGIIEATTGAGKGAMVVGIVSVSDSIRWGIFAPTNELIDDLYNRLTANGYDVGRFTADYEDIKPITLFSYGKLNALRNSKDPADRAHYKSVLASLQGVIVDECHLAASEVRALILRYCVNAYWRFGLSGTPEDRSDGRTPVMVGMLGPVMARITYQDLLEKKAVAEADIFMILFRHKDPADRRTYTHFYKANIVNNAARNRLVRRLVKMSMKPAFVFAKFKKHVMDIYDRCGSDGINADFACDTVKKPRKLQMLASMRSGDIDVICTTPKTFGTGIDVPGLMTVINAGGGESAVDSTQTVGRGMRRAKARFIVLDIYDLGFKRQDGSPAAFEKNARERMRTYLKKGYKVSIFEYDYSNDTLIPYKREV